MLLKVTRTLAAIFVYLGMSEADFLLVVLLPLGVLPHPVTAAHD